MSATQAKNEPMDTTTTLSETSDFDPVTLESAIIQLCLQYPNGVSDKILENSFRSVTAQQRVSALNRLLSLNKIDLLKSTSEPGTFIYRIRDTKTALGSSITVTGGGTTDQMERVVYQLVKESGSLGIWMRDIRIKTKLSQIILNKTLKSLESKKLIKAVKSVHASKKKVYMLYEMTPDPTITGGTWYSDHEFEAEFVRVLNEQCARLLDERLEESMRKFAHDPFARRTSSFMSSIELAALINEMGVANVQLSVQDIETILYTLICDGKVEKTTTALTATTDNANRQNLYRSVRSVLDSSPVVRNPCGICPIFKDCHDDGLITPDTCVYLNKWLDF